MIGCLTYIYHGSNHHSTPAYRYLKLTCTPEVYRCLARVWVDNLAPLMSAAMALVGNIGSLITMCPPVTMILASCGLHLVLRTL